MLRISHWRIFGEMIPNSRKASDGGMAVDANQAASLM